MKSFFYKMFRIFSVLIPVNKNKAILLFNGYSGSNILPIIENKSLLTNKGFDVQVVDLNKNKSLYKNKEINRIKFIFDEIKKYYDVARSGLIVATHGFPRLNNKTLMVNLWHGIPLKGMGLMHQSQGDDVGNNQDDYILSTAPLHTTIMNACLGYTAKHYKILGYPRNDLLFSASGRKNLEEVSKVKLKSSTKVIVYMPTYRRLGEGNIFTDKNFDALKMEKFLQDHDLLMVVKLHPNEEEKYQSYFSEHDFQSIKLLRSSDLNLHKMDLYKVLNAADMLITDYSSVYFDYLLLDRPMVFTPLDIETYKQTEGFLLEPYDFWTPGPKSKTQENLEKTILEELGNPGHYATKREAIKNLVHEHQDANSTKRVFEFLEDQLQKL